MPFYEGRSVPLDGRTATATDATSGRRFHLFYFGFYSGKFRSTDTNFTWPRIRDLLGRDPTRIEEELAIHLIRTGHLYTVEEVIFGKRPFTCPTGALTPVPDLILEKWNSMERTHQDAHQSQLQGLLWRIRDPEVSEPGSYRTVGIDWIWT